MNDYLLIDGYNVINAWQEFAALRRQSLEHAREMLTADIAGYAAFKGYRALLVFDAQEVPGSGSVSSVHGIDVVFTDEGETADSWIERRAYELARAGHRVFVVTSDYAEQLTVLGSGAYRISAREFREDYQAARRAIAKRLRHPARSVNRNELGERLQGSVLEHLENLRRL